MTKAELESKHLAELHELAAEAGIERYRMLPRTELIAKLAGGGGPAGGSKPRGERSGGGSGRRRQRDRAPRERREDETRGDRGARAEREEGAGDDKEGERKREPTPAPEPTPPVPAPAAASERPKRKRRRRWGRRPKGVRLHDLLLPASGRQAIVYAESRAGCTTLLREVAAELSGASDGPDPIALLVDPTPEELADWKREAPEAEIVSAGKAQHAGDAIAQARSRAGAGEDVIVLVDSLSRFAEAFGGPEEARALFDAGSDATGGGSLTVVAALERGV